MHVTLYGKVLKSVAYKYLSLVPLAFEFLHDISPRIHPCFTDVLFAYTYIRRHVHSFDERVQGRFSTMVHTLIISNLKIYNSTVWTYAFSEQNVKHRYSIHRERFSLCFSCSWKNFNYRTIWNYGLHFYNSFFNLLYSFNYITNIDIIILL